MFILDHERIGPVATTQGWAELIAALEQWRVERMEELIDAGEPTERVQAGNDTLREVLRALRDVREKAEGST